MEHYVSFTTPTQKNRFLNTLNLEGFTFKDDIGVEDFEHGVALIKNHAVTPDEVEKNVNVLYEVVKLNQGFYEGWSTVLIESMEE